MAIIALFLAVQLSTRLFGHKTRNSLLVPLVDMANHFQDCPNTYR